MQFPFYEIVHMWIYFCTLFYNHTLSTFSLLAAYFSVAVSCLHCLLVDEIKFTLVGPSLCNCGLSNTKAQFSGINAVGIGQ